MLIPILLYSFFLFLKLAVRLGLSLDLVSAWPMFIGVGLGVNFWRLDNRLSVLSSRLSDFSLSVFGRSVFPTGKPKTDKPEVENRKLKTDNWNISQNIIFAAGWAIVALFGMTSAIGWLGKGVVLGVGLQLAVRVAKDLTISPEKIGWFFEPVKRQLPKNEMVIAALTFLAFFLVISFF